MRLPLRFKCSNCDQWHEGVPGWAYPFPMVYFDVPESEREERCYLSDDLCVVDDQRFFVRGCIDLPVCEHSDVLVIGAWVEVSEEDFFEFQDLLGVEKREMFGPYSGKLSAAIPTYENTEGLKVSVLLKDGGTRPSLRLETPAHRLTIEQRGGLPMERLQSIYTHFERLRTPG